MPVTFLGAKIKPIDGGSGVPIVKLSARGETLHFRLADINYGFDGKHFLKDEYGSTVVPCQRIMAGETCKYCEEYFSYKKKIKELKTAGRDQVSLQKLVEMARRNSPSINFYFPVLDRRAVAGRILQTKLSVRLQLEDEVRRGIKVLNFDYLLERTEKPGSDYYKLTRFDSADTKPLSDEEKSIIEELQALDLNGLLNVRNSNRLFDATEEQE